MQRSLILALTLGLPLSLSAGEPGKMTREIWYKIPGSHLSPSPSSPRYSQPADSVSSFTGAAVPQNIGDQFASRVRGYITAPETGSYTFWLASDDESELRLSPTASKFGRTKIAWIADWVQPFDWDAGPSQKSAQIQLLAGQRYFIEALSKEGGGGDHLAIAWQVPGGSRVLIPASALESFTTDTEDLDHDELADTWELAHGFNIAAASDTPPSQRPTADPDYDGYTNQEEATYGMDPNQNGGLPGALLLETWNNLPGSSIEALTFSNKFGNTADTSEFIFTAETPVNRGDNFGVRMRGYIIAPTSGNYIFHLAGDDSCQLWLSPNTSQFARQKIAGFNGWTPLRDWGRYPSQTSTPVALVAGQKYYVEALMKEAGGGDHLEIAWETPGSTAISIIPSSALESYAYDVEDPEGDNLPSAWEITHGLDPAVNDAALDPDLDGIQNRLEFAYDSNPQVKNSMVGALLHEIWWHTPALRALAPTAELQRLQTPAVRTLAPAAEGPSYSVGFTDRLRGYLTAPVTGTYTFWARGDEEIEFWLSPSASQHAKQRLIHPISYTWDFDADVSMKSRNISLQAGERYYLEILHINHQDGSLCSVAWQIPGGQREIIPGSALATFITTADDQDDDGLLDAWEIANGLDPTDNGRLQPKNGARGDLDADGLDNLTESNVGTRANLTDTDGDGVSDYDEVKVLKTSPTTVDVAAFQSVAILPGSGYSATTGTWLPASGKAKQDCVRGSLDYPVTLSTAGVYQLDLTFTPVADVTVSQDYEIVFSVDGKSIERQILTVPEATSGHAKVLTPWLTVGSHTLRVFVDNSYHFRRVTVDQLEILAASGPDTNSNGTPDWVDVQLASRNSLEASAHSLTSPVCVEGKARWSELTTLTGATVQVAPDDRWYADVPLHATQPTAITASLENGGLIATRQITWIPTNLLTSGNLSIRLGDSLKLSAFNGTAGTPEEAVTLTVEGQTVTITADQPLVHAFNTPGSVPVQVTHSLDGNLTTATITINVVTAPVLDSPVCVVGYYREVSIPVLPTGITLQLDHRIEIRSTNANPAGSKLHIAQLNTLEDRNGILRLGGGTGPILASLPFNAARIRTGLETGLITSYRPEGSIWSTDMPFIVDCNSPGISLNFDIFIGGVTFNNGSTTIVIHPDNYLVSDGSGKVTFLKVGNTGSICHRVSVFQGLIKIANKQ